MERKKESFLRIEYQVTNAEDTRDNNNSTLAINLVIVVSGKYHQWLLNLLSDEQQDI